MTSSKIKIRKATIKDVPKIVSLIGTFAKQGQMLKRKPEEIVLNLRDFFVAVKPRSKTVLGCASLHLYTDRLSEIKALAVRQSARNLGVGKRLISRCLREAKALGLPRVFVLTYIPDFFVKLGFVPSNKELLPEKIWIECAKCAKQHNCTENCLVYLLPR